MHPKPRGPTSAQLRDAIDRGRTGSKVPFQDPAAAPLGTDDEAAGTPPRPDEIRSAMVNELRNAGRHRPDGRDAHGAMGVKKVRPKRAVKPDRAE